MKGRGFTLIELVIAIAISVVITAAIYLTLNTALQSWGESRDQLALQKVFSELMSRVLDGTAAEYGVKDALEITSAGSGRIEFVPPWVDDTHTVSSQDALYELNCRIKPGAAVPIGEIKLPGSNDYMFIPVRKIELEDSTESEVSLGLSAPEGSKLRFTYHPDSRANPDAVKKTWWDPQDGQIYSEDKDGTASISENAFGVKITDCRFRYFDNANNLITESDSVDEKDLNMITGVELYIEARMGANKQSLLGFVSLRNAPMRSGYITLRQGTRLAIPNSANIHTLSLTNFSGVSNGDELQIEAVPSSGKAWVITIKFSKAGLSKPKIESYAVEYPPGQVVYTEFPKTNTEDGLNLLSLGTDGLYDYDDDAYIDDAVILEGEVIIEIKKMDIDGAGLFVRP